TTTNGCKCSASRPATFPILPWSWRRVSNTGCNRLSALLTYEARSGDNKKIEAFSFGRLANRPSNRNGCGDSPMRSSRKVWSCLVAVLLLLLTGPAVLRAQDLPPAPPDVGVPAARPTPPAQSATQSPAATTPAEQAQRSLQTGDRL